MGLPVVNHKIAALAMYMEETHVVAYDRWMSTTRMVADKPSRDGVPDWRTFAGRPLPLDAERAMRGPEWLAGMAAWADPVVGARAVREVVPAPPAPTGEDVLRLCVSAEVPGLALREPVHFRELKWRLGTRSVYLVHQRGCFQGAPWLRAVRDEPYRRAFAGDEGPIVDGD